MVEKTWIIIEVNKIIFIEDNMNNDLQDLMENKDGFTYGEFIIAEGEYLEVFNKYGRLYGAATFDGDKHYVRTKEIKKELKKTLW